MPVNRATAVALYEQIARQLAAEIAAGAFAAEGRLPTERELMARFGVSRVTVRHAMGQLFKDGKIVRRQGKGTFVGGPSLQHDLHSMRGFYDSLLTQGVHPRTELLEFAAQPGAATPLGAGGTGPCFLLRRRYVVEGLPIAHVRAWLPPEAAAVSWQQASEHPIYGILEQLLGLKVARSNVRIRVEPADAQDAGALGLAEGDALLVMERSSLDAAGRRLEHTTFHIRPERYEFVLNTHGPLPISSAIEDAGRTPVGGTG